MYEQHVGKTVARIEEQQFFGRDTFKDEVRWTAVTVHFTDGSSLALAEDDRDVYSAQRQDGVCFYCEQAVHRAADGSLIDMHETSDCYSNVNPIGYHTLQEQS